MKQLLAIYHNPEAKKALLWWFSFVGISIIILYSSLQWLDQTYRQETLQNLTKALATTHTHDSLDDFFYTGILSNTAQLEYTRLNRLSIFPRLTFPTTTTPLIWLWIGWFSLIAISFIGMTLYFKKFYAHIQKLQYFVQELSEHHKPYDIRQNKEGEVSILTNQLYDMASALYIQRDNAIQHKNYLNKNIVDISHQLKTPLTSLIVVSDTLKILPLSERTNDKIEQLEPQIERIEHLVQSLLLLARLDAGVIQLKVIPIDIMPFMNDIISRFTVLAEHKDITIQLETHDVTKMFADKFYLGEAITNVLKNAIDHTPNQGQITITIEDSLFFTSIKIHNTGSAISKKDLPYIFERFYRGKNEHKKGIGIGLSLAQELTKNHHGKLHAENTSNGVLMTFSIPKL